MQLTSDLSQLDPNVRHALIRRLQHADKARFDLGLVEQRRLKQLHDRAGIGAYKENLGPVEMVLSIDKYQRAMQRYGQHIFMDPDFAKWLLRKNDDMRVKPTATRIQVGYTGGGHA